MSFVKKPSAVSRYLNWAVGQDLSTSKVKVCRTIPLQSTTECSAILLKTVLGFFVAGQYQPSETTVSVPQVMRRELARGLPAQNVRIGVSASQSRPSANPSVDAP